MSNISETQPAKLGFWKRLALAFEAAEKTETDYMWDEIIKLRTRQNELEQELRATSQQQAYLCNTLIIGSPSMSIATIETKQVKTLSDWKLEMHINFVILIASVAITVLILTLGLDLLRNGKPIFSMLGFITIIVGTGLLSLVFALLIELYPNWRCLLLNPRSPERCSKQTCIYFVQVFNVSI